MIVTSFSLENYKSFGSSNVGSRLANLQQVNMIYGNNNSGKSNLLKFLELIFRSKVDREFISIEGEQTSRILEQAPFWRGIILDEPFIFHKNNRNEPIKFSFTIEIKHSEIEDFDYYDILKKEYLSPGREKVSINMEGKILNHGDAFTSLIELDKVNLNGKEIYSSDAGSKSYFKGKSALNGDSQAFQSFMGYFTDLVHFIDTNRFFENEKEGIISKVLSPKTFKTWLYNLYTDPIQYEEFLKFVEFVKVAKISSDSTLTNFNPTFARHKGNIELMLEKKVGDGRFPLSSFGTGIQQMLYILASLYEAKSKVVLIEELELNLSPITQVNIFKGINNLVAAGKVDQVFFTTHSDFFNFRNDFGIYEVQINTDGVSQVLTKKKPSSSFFKKLLVK